jgi:hypothetical protein
MSGRTGHPRPSPQAVRTLILLASWCSLLALGCGDDTTGPAAPPAPPPTPRLCPPPPGVSARPRSIAESVALVNALPRPVTVACFLESLERPLHLNATRSFISLQPAMGARSPRLFLMFEGMSLSVVPEGNGAKLIEFGEFVTPERTLKAEIKTPVTAPLDPADPFNSPKATSGVNAGMGTTCRTCHSVEERWEQIPFADAFVSTALRPDPRSDVPLDRVVAERQACADDDHGERCTILRALLDHGEVLHRPFPETLPTIFD